MNKKRLLSYVLCNTIILWLNIVFYSEKMIVYSLWSRDPDSSKQKVKTIDFQVICLSIDYDFKDGIFLHCQHQRILTFLKFLTYFFEKLNPPLRFQQKCFSVNFKKFLRTYFDRAPPDDGFLSLSVSFEKFFRTSLL